jgi:hypothetical protein
MRRRGDAAAYSAAPRAGTMRINEHIKEEVRAANDLVEVIGDYVQLKRQGSRYLGLGPCHK